jgi:hypothetical protein
MKLNDRQVIIGNYQSIGVSLIFVIRYRYIIDMLRMESMTALHTLSSFLTKTIYILQ